MKPHFLQEEEWGLIVCTKGIKGYHELWQWHKNAEKFYAHNKDTPREALPKLENTEIPLRYFLSNREEADRP